MMRGGLFILPSVGLEAENFPAVSRNENFPRRFIRLRVVPYFALFLHEVR